MKDLSLDKQLQIFTNEVLEKKIFVSIVFAIVSVIVLLAGVNWPKIYESNTSILWTKSDPISALLQQQRGGGNPRATVREQVEIAKGVILSNKILDQLINRAGLDVDNNEKRLSKRDVEIFKGGLRSTLQVYNMGPSVIKIAYRNTDPEIAYLIVSIVTELFLQETRRVKNQNSQSAFDFINRQVRDYKHKLDNINKRIIEFRKANVDLDSDTRTGVNTRVNDLKLSIRNTTLLLTEVKVQRKSIVDQLSIEKKKIERQLTAESLQASTIERESAYAERLQTLQSNLDTLRLSYTENYPDIVQLKEQIKNLKVQIEQENQGEKNQKSTTVDNRTNEISFVESPLYVQLLGEKSDAETQIKTLEARISDTNNRLNKELLRAGKVNTLESSLEEMTRDLGVTQNIYDDLLTRRENARVSLNLQLENQTSTFKVQDPAVIPLVPVGLRFLHFALGSVALGLLAPMALIYGWLFISSGIRHEDSIEYEMLKIPVIGVVEHYSNEADKKKEKRKNIIAISIFIISFVMLTAIIILKINQVIGV